MGLGVRTMREPERFTPAHVERENHHEEIILTPVGREPRNRSIRNGSQNSTTSCAQELISYQIILKSGWGTNKKKGPLFWLRLGLPSPMALITPPSSNGEIDRSSWRPLFLDLLNTWWPGPIWSSMHGPYIYIYKIICNIGGHSWCTGTTYRAVNLALWRGIQLRSAQRGPQSKSCFFIFIFIFCPNAQK